MASTMLETRLVPVLKRRTTDARYVVIMEYHDGVVIHEEVPTMAHAREKVARVNDLCSPQPACAIYRLCQATQHKPCAATTAARRTGSR